MSQSAHRLSDGVDAIGYGQRIDRPSVQQRWGAAGGSCRGRLRRLRLQQAPKQDMVCVGDPISAPAVALLLEPCCHGTPL